MDFTEVAPVRGDGCASATSGARSTSRMMVVACLRSAPKSDAVLTGSPFIDSTRSPARSCPERCAGEFSPIACSTTASPSKSSPRPRLSFGVRSRVTATLAALRAAAHSAGARDGDGAVTGASSVYVRLSLCML